MCRLVDVALPDRVVRVADVKRKYVPVIYEAAKNCPIIERVVLFGSATEERCRKESDMDLAVFGNLPKAKGLTSPEYDRFVFSIVDYDSEQDYDLLYFPPKKKRDERIQKDIGEGVVLYERKSD